MPKLTFKKNNKIIKEVELKEGEEISEACEEQGISFACHNGVCGTCMIKIEKGNENLSERTEFEDILCPDEETRLACQCQIKSGDVIVDL